MTDVLAEPDPNAEYWFHEDIARYLKVKETSVRVYRHRNDLPAEDKMEDGRPQWRPERIIAWKSTRAPGQGRRRPGR